MTGAHDEELTWRTGFRVAVVHSFYGTGQPSGENRIVEQQVGALRDAGYSVRVFAQHTDERQGRLYPLEAGATVATGRGPSPLGDISEFEPDVVHVHNLFPNFGRAWVNRLSGALVAAMHNYRPLCPAATFYRDGHVCTDCLDVGSARPAVRHGCYRGSRAQTLPLAIGTRFRSDPVLERADRITTLSTTMRDLYVGDRADLRQKTVVAENFVPTESAGGLTAGGDRWVYAGRLSPEKGILDVVRDWPANHHLTVLGAGPQEAEVRAAAGPSVDVVGAVDPAEVRAHLEGAVGLVFPSRWLEGMALVCLEALAVGTPILAFPPAAAAQTVSELGVGAVAGRDLCAALDDAAGSFPAMRGHCRTVFEDRYSEEAWLARTRQIYDEALTSQAALA